MNIVITAGGTSEHIDEVRKITNSSSGKLGATIANKFKKDKIFYICTKKSIRPNNKNIEYIEVEETKDLEKEVRKVLKENQIDLFIHSMAVSDYTVDYVTTSKKLSQAYNNISLEEYLKTNKNKLTDKKISSYEDDLIIRLVKTPKIINIIKKISPETILVGFKLLNDVSKKELIETAIKLKEKNNCDYVVANDLTNITENNHQAYIINKENKIREAKTKKEIAEELYKIIHNKIK